MERLKKEINKLTELGYKQSDSIKILKNVWKDCNKGECKYYQHGFCFDYCRFPSHPFESVKIRKIDELRNRFLDCPFLESIYGVEI